MPEISRFLGIVITTYYNDHPQPHFHARYGDHKAKFGIETGALRDGFLPRRATDLGDEWRTENLVALLAVWQQILDRQPHDRIRPLE